MNERIKLTGDIKNVYKDARLIHFCEEGKDECIYAEIDDLDEHGFVGGERVTLWGEYITTYGKGRILRADTVLEDVTHPFWWVKWAKRRGIHKPKEIINLVLGGIIPDGLTAAYRDTNKALEYFHVLAKDVQIELLSRAIEKSKWNIETIATNPYQLLLYEGITHTHLSKMMREFGEEDPKIAKGIYLLEHALRGVYQNGHTAISEKVVISIFQKHHIPIGDVLTHPKFVTKWGRVMLREQFEREVYVTTSIKKRLVRTEQSGVEEDITKWEAENFTLAKSQRLGVEMALAEQFSIITGGPGTGKTTVCKCAISLLSKMGVVQVVAPTGRAAKRAEESTGLPAQTAHKLLGYNGKTYKRNEQNQIECDILLIDEFSMVDIELFEALLEATPLTTKILLLGDVDQLPSVGAGQVLRDLLESDEIPYTKLTDIFRQAADSPIIKLAYAVNNGEIPDVKKGNGFDMKELPSEVDIFDETVRIAVSLYETEDPIQVQILIPKYEGTCGIYAINEALQASLNQGEPYVTLAGKRWKKGDKVICTKTLSKLSVTNGDVGVIKQVNDEGMTVKFDGNSEVVDFTERDVQSLQLAYAVTVHKSQGSEYKHCIIPLVESYGRMLQRNLFYTAITRAKKELTILVSGKALHDSVSEKNIVKRVTNLKNLLKPA